MTQHNKPTTKTTASPPPDIHHQWLNSLRRLGKSSHTFQAYHRGLEHFARWYAVTYGEAFTVDAVMPRDVRDSVDPNLSDEVW